MEKFEEENGIGEDSLGREGSKYMFSQNKVGQEEENIKEELILYFIRVKSFYEYGNMLRIFYLHSIF